MKRILPEFELSDEQLNIVRGLARECGICEQTAGILYGRGVRDKESINNFLHPSKSRFISPFKMSGMKQAVELITRARDEQWVVVVYGDYDADGICASTIMGNSLRDFGIEPILCVPERTNGYGLSTDLIDALFDEYFPQLFITVDCGISCAEEVEYIKEMGAEVIVTDHHELPEKIPDCICINPKFNDEYVYDNLCGAGVAFKVGCALNGESAYKYLDFATIATIADSVPLTGENRDIVYEGLKLINGKPSNCYAGFLNKQDTVTAQTIAFSIAPKINAAGRMGDANSALALFNERDESKITELSAKLTAYNAERQKCCDELYTSAKEMLKTRPRSRIILLCNESWNSGFVGIVAARLAEEYSCPAILFVKNNGMLKGSARSVENVNIFEALKACSEYISEFGGHSQAAGVNVAEENFEKLSRALEKYMNEHYVRDDFVPTVLINGNLRSGYSERLVKELEMLEPCGVGNRRPVFVTEEKSLPVRLMGAQANHVSAKDEKLELMFFNGLKYKQLIECSAPKSYVFEFSVSSFRGKEYVKGIVRHVIYDKSAIKCAGEDIALCALSALSQPAVQGKISRISAEEIEALMSNDTGTLFIAYDYANAERFSGFNGINCDLFIPSSKNFSSTVLFAPLPEADLSGYGKIVYLDRPELCLKHASLNGREVYCAGGEVSSFGSLSCNREELLGIFSQISARAGTLYGASTEETVRQNVFGNKLQTLFALKVFEELGLISYAQGKIQIIRGVKSKLENSKLYNTIGAWRAD